MLNSESRRLYSWWWDSHISPKNSKWLQENLTDMDSKVKSMIKLIEEDADSFARRAEMYYKKRPELMKLVEEFYRAYRALAERYDYATSELRHAQKTLQAAFPDQEQFTLPEDPSSSVNPNDKENESFGLQLFLEGKLQNPNEKDECEIEKLKKAVADLIAEKDELFIQYQCSLEKLANADEEVNHAVEKLRILEEKASEADKEVHMLKVTLGLLQAEKESGLNKQMEYLETISDLEEKINGMDKRAVESEAESQDLMNKLTKLESENDAGLLKYGKCLEKISVLERKIMVTEEKAKMFSEQKIKAEMEVEKLKNALSELTEEKEALRVLYSECLEKSYKLEFDLSSAQSDVQRLTNEIVNSTKKLKNVEEICVRLEKSNESLKMEASDLAKKIMLKDQELSNKHDELEKLQSFAKDELTHYVQVEATLETLKMLYIRSQEEQRNLAVELKKGLQMVKDLEICKSGLEEEMKQVKGDNENLKKSEVEFMSLKEKLEEEVALQLGQSTAMQKEICNLKEEITELNTGYNSLVSQLELAGLNPESFGSSVKCLQDENSRLKQICGGHEEKIKLVIEKNNDLESSCESLHVEKSALVLEKSVLLSQLHVISVNMQKVTDQNTVLENSLSTANIELENLRVKSKGLEEVCKLLNIEKCNLVAERSMLASQLENVQKRLEILENRFMQFEERCGVLEKEKETGDSQMLRLISSLRVEKQERETFMIANQKRLNDLENHIREFHELKKEEFQEELDKAVIAQFENVILHKFVKEVEEKNHYLSIENEKHISASKLADKLISELETEILEQQVEEELLLVEVENLRLGIYQVFLSLEIGSNHGFESSKISVEEIIENIKDLKRCLLKEEDEKQQLLIENSVILTLLQAGFRQSKDDFLKVKKENLDLNEVNENLGWELDMLHEELEERKNIQENLTCELQERENEFELWDAEATSFIFDLQVSNTRDILFETKVHQLAEACENLEGETALKDQEIQEMKQKASAMEGEIKELKAQLLAYAPVIASLKENVSSLEHTMGASDNQAKDVDVAHQSNGISDLIEVQTRIAALEKVIKPNEEQKRNKLRGRRYLTLDITKAKPEISEVRKGVPIRDIPLDQASDGSSSANSRSRSRMRSDELQTDRELPYEPQIEDLGVDVPNRKGKFLHRLRSDAQKLANLETTVKDLTRRIESGKKSKKAGVDFETVKEQLEEAEETILQLVNVNVESTANPSWDGTWKSSDKIKRVQLEVQKIQYMLLELDEKKRSRFSRTKSVIWSRGSGRRRRLCGCFTPSPTKGDHIKI
ncbi:hypothetical protein L1987_40710 [Smallanthus sonchifolius]|uniref:Uncharacterized protein n=1 Tax=Smallanthus sonchifolius TaxID=185202 RepID=A0ACB9GUL3_9ASTR|nr:hypothetical protein L1987_40710 [Smallanthus sonchifolius]